MNLSKSRYVAGVTCKKKLWLSCYRKDEAEDMGNESIFNNGTKIGELARSLFGDYVLINFTTNYEEMIEETKKQLENKSNIICEASFSYDNNFCSIDILKNDIDGVEIYEVKSSTIVKDIYIDDVAYQTWVLKKYGLNVKKSYIVYVNGEYIKNGELNLHEFFKIDDVSDSIDFDKVEENIKELKEIINNTEEPNVDLSISCHKPYDCPFFKYCTRNLPTPNVFDIGWNVWFDKKIDMYKRGHITYDDIINNESLTDKALEQLKIAINDSEAKINKESIRNLINSFTYPLYFLDFESYQSCIPTIDGTKPNQQICFQYSLDYYLEENGKLYHKEYLSGDYDGNPMYGLCKRLCEDIPMNSCVIVYNKTFEQTRLTEMAKLLPEFSTHLLNIRDNIKDLSEPFSNQDYYVKEMGGSWSIKVVLPALFPDDEGLDYHKLEQVHKGDEASSAYLSLPTLTKEEQEKLRYNMLKYCGLDTYAMVKIYDKLKKSIAK